MCAKDGGQLFIKVPLSCLKFANLYEQMKFERRLADAEDKAELIQEIEGIVCSQTIEIFS